MYTQQSMHWIGRIMIKVKDLVDGSKGVGTYLVNNVTQGVTNKGSKYLSVTLGDDSGLIEGKFWNASEEDIINVIKGNIIEANYDISVYNGALQMRINSATLADQAIDKSQFVMKSSVPTEQLKDVIRTACYSIQDPIYQQLVLKVFAKVGQRFFEMPAASKNHHNFYAGLATHVMGMIKLGNVLCDLYPSLNRDLLISGILLHDIGKCYELDSYVATAYTIEGNLVGHISIMHGHLMEIAHELNVEDKEQTLLLRHMILSHHGLLEYGSPIRPALKEAEMLYYIDNIDAKMNMLDQLLDKCEPGNFSERCFALDNRRFYRPKEANEN